MSYYYYDCFTGSYITEGEWVNTYGENDFEENKKRIDEEENNKNKE